MAPEALPKAYRDLYPQQEKNKETAIKIPYWLSEFENRIYHDYRKGLEEANNIAEKKLGTSQHIPKEYKIECLPLTKHGDKIGIIKGLYNPKEDSITLNSAFYGDCCNPLLIDYDKGEIRLVRGCYRLNESPLDTIVHEIGHRILSDLYKNHMDNERATRKLFGS